MQQLLNKNIRLPFSGRYMPLKYAIVHFLYWLLITAFFIYEKKYLIYKAGLPSFISCVAFRVGLLMLVAYINLNYLLPRFLLKGRYLLYVSGVLLSIAGYLVLQALFDVFLYGYVLGPMRSNRLWETISYNFFSTLWYIGLVVAVKLSIDWFEQKRLLGKTAVEKLQAEVNYLRAQLNPHFLFNVLNNLYGLTLKKSDDAPDMVLKLSEMMEYMLYQTEADQVPLDNEIQYLRNYIELEKVRYGNHAEFVFEVNGDTGQHMIAPLLLLPLVENAFKHGVSKSAHKAWLHCSINCEATVLNVHVENNKQQPTSKARNGGIGLVNLQQRLNLLYPGHHTIQIKNEADRFSVFLTLNY